MRGTLGAVNQVGAISIFVLIVVCFDLCMNQIKNFSLLQLSVTIGILLAYLLGLFVNWRILAVLGESLRFRLLIYILNLASSNIASGKKFFFFCFFFFTND